jgi:endonuclease/exonuclease/phosphatase family metal-dependent hydrolase
MTYNVHSCRGTDGVHSHERIARVIEAFDPDIVALQELDVFRRRTGHLDQATEIARLVSMESHFHPAIRVADELYGDAILSKHPLRLVRAGELPNPTRKWVDETRGALWVSVNVGNVEWQVINTHFGLGRGERRLQAAALLGDAWLGAAIGTGGPVCVCGDFNSPSGGTVHRMFQAKLQDAQTASPTRRIRRTFSTSMPVLCLDYIFLDQRVRALSTEVPRTPLTKIASDHFPLIADLEFTG